MPEKNSLQRVAFSPGEFAALFGKQQTWGYRQIYAGKVNAITEHGRILIPAAEVERILATAARYEGIKKKPIETKAELEAMKPALQSAWQGFVQRKREGKNSVGPKAATDGSLPESAVTRPNARKAALGRLTAGKEKPRQ